MTDYRFYTDPEYPGMQWRYLRTPSGIFCKGEVRLDGGAWIPATTTMLHHERALARKELYREG